MRVMQSVASPMFPPVPKVPDAQRASGSYPIRFEDLSQDGRVHFEPLVASIDAAIWRPMLSKEPLVRSLHAAGVRPIFTRLALEVGPARVSLGATLLAEGVYELAHEPDGRGGAARLFLNMWTTVRAVKPARAKHEDAEQAEKQKGEAREEPIVGRLFAEHQLTRLLAPPAERRVVSLPDGAPLPQARYEVLRHEALLEPPAGATWLESEPRPDPAGVQFGLSHTDINQHVNSLVYPRLFGEAALRRLADLGASTRALSSRLDISFRKPFFAGEAAAIHLRAYRDGDAIGAAGTFVPKAAPAPGAAPRPHVFVRLGLAT